MALQPLPNEPSTGSTLTKTLINCAITRTIHPPGLLEKSCPQTPHPYILHKMDAFDIMKEAAVGPDMGKFTTDDWNPTTCE